MTATTMDALIAEQPRLLRILNAAGWSWRHPRASAIIRLLAGAWDLGLGILMLTSGSSIGGYAWLGLIPLLASPLLLWTAYRLSRFAEQARGLAR